MGLVIAPYWLETEPRPLSYQQLISSCHWPQENWMRECVWLSISLPPASKQLQAPGLIAVSHLVCALESSAIKPCCRAVIPQFPDALGKGKALSKQVQLSQNYRCAVCCSSRASYKESLSSEEIESTDLSSIVF